MKQILALAGVLGIAGAAWAALPQDSEPKGRGVRTHEQVLEEEVGLSDAQVSQIAKLRSDAAKAAIRKRADLRIARMELRELLDAPSVDEKAVNAKVKEVSDLQAAAFRARVDARLAVRKIVSAEQFQKMRELMRERRGLRRRGPEGDRPGRAARRGPRRGALVDGGDGVGAEER